MDIWSKEGLESVIAWAKYIRSVEMEDGINNFKKEKICIY